MFPVLVAISHVWGIAMSLVSSDSGQGGLFSPSQREVVKGIESRIMILNRVIYSIAVTVLMACFISFLYAVLLYKEEVIGFLQRNDSRRTLWRERILLFTTAAMTVLAGLYVHWVMEKTQLGRVKPLEYWLIFLPAEVVVGIMVATKLQRKWERRQEQGELQ